MSKVCRLTCVFLSLIILLSAAFCNTFRVSAAEVVYYVKGSGVNVREDASQNSNILGNLSYVYVTKNGEKQGTDGYVWFNITYGDITGYIRNDYIEEIPVVTDQSFEEQLDNFPDSYKEYLRLLHSVYPNWKFYADNIDMTLDEAAKLELVSKVTDYKSLSWRSMDLGSYDWSTGKWVSKENNRWYYVSREVIKYYMDPRNFLNANSIYTFLQQSYDPVHQTEAGLRKVISGTFLEKGYDGDSDAYVKDIMTAASESKVNPYILAGTIIQEQGPNGTSNLISGSYEGYEGYYNFFNVGAIETNPTIFGLEKAKLEGWDTRSKSIIGGAKFCGNNYVSAGQNTYFYMNYNIKDPDRIWHQYATAVHNASSSGEKLAKTYAELKDAELDFLIPVYKDMPSAVSAIPEKNEKLNNYYFDSISAHGLTPSFNRFTYSYDLKVTGDTTVRITVPEGASYAGAESYQLVAGNNRISLSVKSQSGYINDYYIYVDAGSNCTLYVDSSGDAPLIVCGDTNGDGIINGRDLANVQMHILLVQLLSGDAFLAGDTNGDGIINGRDLVNVQMHILGVKSLN